jgi:ABC-type multidrug transport system ATPase subunit
LLILDDPTLGLDAVARRMVVDELIATLATRGVTVIIATHDLATIERFAEHVVILGHHRLLLSEPMESLKRRFRRIRGPKAAAFAGFQTVREVDHPWGREAIVSDFSDERFESWRSGQDGVEALSLSLEEIFLATAGEEAES